MRSARSIDSCGHVGTQLGHRTLLLRRDVGLRPLADLVGLGLGPGDQITPHLLGRLPRLLDDPTGLFAAPAIWARYCAFSDSASVRAFSAPSRSLRMRSSRACSMFFTAGTPNFHMATSSTRNAAVPQMTSFLAGSNGDGAFWQSSGDATVRELLVALLRSLVGELRRRFGRERGRGHDEHRDGDAGDCDERTDASTHRSSCPGFSPR